MSLLGSAVALAAVAGLFAPASARAAQITFTETTPGTVPQVTFSGFDVQNPAFFTYTDAAFTTTDGRYTTTIANQAQQIGYATLTDPTTGLAFAVEQITFSVVNYVADLSVFFAENNPPLPTSRPAVPSSGVTVITNNFTDDSGTPVALPPGATATVVTGTVVTAVPEPASLALLSGGLAGFGLLRRRRA